MMSAYIFHYFYYQKAITPFSKVLVELDTPLIQNQTMTMTFLSPPPTAINTLTQSQQHSNRGETGHEDIEWETGQKNTNDRATLIPFVHEMSSVPSGAP